MPPKAASHKPPAKAAGGGRPPGKAAGGGKPPAKAAGGGKPLAKAAGGGRPGGGVAKADKPAAGGAKADKPAASGTKVDRPIGAGAKAGPPAGGAARLEKPAAAGAGAARPAPEAGRGAGNIGDTDLQRRQPVVRPLQKRQRAAAARAPAAAAGAAAGPVRASEGPAGVVRPPQKRPRAAASGAQAAAAGAAAGPMRASEAAASQLAALAVGDKVQLVGLKAAPELNGVLGTATSFDAERGHWSVQLDCGRGTRDVPMSNLVRIAAGVPGADAATTPPRRPPSLPAGATGSRPARAARAKAAPAAPAAPEAQALAAPKAQAAAVGAPAAADAGPAAPAGRGQGAGRARGRGRGSGGSGRPGAARAAAGAGSRGAGKAPAGTAALAAAPLEPARKRLRTKRAQDGDEEVTPLAQLISKLAADGEAEEAAASQGSAAAPPPAPKQSAREAKRAAAAVEAELRAAAKLGEEAEELDGEAKRERGGGRPAAAGRAGVDDEDKLFEEDEEEDLEGEEAISEASDGEPDDDDGDAASVAWKPVGALPWPDAWGSGLGKPTPGEQGFNAYAAECIAKAELGGPSSPFAGLGMRLHQESAAFLLHPSSPIQRLLVDHATGTGKTLVMLRILDNFFDDPRPKVAIFPKDRVCDNFYQELLKWPTRWRHFFAFSRPEDAALASGAKDWRRKRSDVWDMGNDRLRFEAKTRGVRLEKVIRELIDSMREVLEMKNAIHRGKVKARFAQRFLEEHPGAPVPRAPLRAFRYTTAGGCACQLSEADGWPRSPILKVGFDPSEMNPYSNKLVIMDEAHNLARPTMKYQLQLDCLAGHLALAKGTVLAGFTGTPVGNDAAEGRELLDVIKGKAAKQLSDEGFVSSFHARASADFPREEPVKGIPDGIIHEGMYEQLLKQHSLHGEALKRYILKEAEFQITPRLLRLPQEKRVARLANYCTLHTHYGAFHTSNRAALLHDVKGHAPKMHAVVKSIIKRPEKTVVMLAREMGFRAMLEVLQKAGKANGFKVATLGELGDFNDARRNLRGERFRVLAAETNQAGEGIQFRHVRRIHLVDVPLRHSDLVQRTSRCVRLGGHEDLPPEERSLAIEMHVAVLPKLLRQGPSSLIYRELSNAKDVSGTTGEALEKATEACVKEIRKRGVKTLLDLQREVQADKGEELIELLTETALEQLGNTNNAPARPLAMALWRLRRGGDDLAGLEKALLNQVKTADEILVDWLADKSAELLPPLEAMRLGAVDRRLLAPLGDPPAAPPAPQQRSERALAKAVERRAAALAAIEPGMGRAAGSGELPAADAAPAAGAAGAGAEGARPLEAPGGEEGAGALDRLDIDLEGDEDEAEDEDEDGLEEPGEEDDLDEGGDDVDDEGGDDLDLDSDAAYA